MVLLDSATGLFERAIGSDGDGDGQFDRGAPVFEAKAHRVGAARHACRGGAAVVARAEARAQGAGGGRRKRDGRTRARAKKKKACFSFSVALVYA